MAVLALSVVCNKVKLEQNRPSRVLLPTKHSKAVPQCKQQVPKLTLASWLVTPFELKFSVASQLCDKQNC